MSADNIVAECGRLEQAGVRAAILFGIPEKKDATGSEGLSDKGVVQRAVRAIKKKMPEFVVATDVCLCEYTDHGHCGVLRSGCVSNDDTLPLLARMALSHARAGADIVAPSDMMDGRVAAIRSALDEEEFKDTIIMSYAAKYCSSFYGPFRDAAGSSPRFGDRRSYQMDPPNAREALLEVEIDVWEGADIIMIKPALPYLDIIHAVREKFPHPIAAYQVSGEYSLIRFGAAKGLIDETRAMFETLTSIKRAGADLILTYFAKTAAELITKGKY
jgi:porphobilinogen synthase